MAKKTLLLLALSARLAFALSCPFQPENDQDTKLLDRINHSLADFKSACSPKKGTALEKNLEAMQEGVAKLDEQVKSEAPIPTLGTWLGTQITCDNYPSFLTDQRDDAYRRHSFQLTPPDSNDYLACFQPAANPQAVPAFVPCIDKVHKDRLAMATEFCNKSLDHTKIKRRQALVSQSYDVLAENFKEMINGMGNDCGGNAEEVRASALRTASTLATTFAAIEPVSAAAGLGIAIGGSILNVALAKFLEKPDLGAQIKTKQQHLEASCLLMETAERDLGCKQLLRVEPPKNEKPILDTKDALFAETTPKRTSALEETLNAFGRVEEDRLPKLKIPESKPAERQPTEQQMEELETKIDSKVDFSSKPVLDLLSAALGQRIEDPTRPRRSRSHPAQSQQITMLDYFEQVAGDLEFSSKCKRGGPSKPEVAQHLDKRQNLAAQLRKNAAKLGPEQCRANGFLAQQLKMLVDAFKEYETAQGTDKAELKRAALLKSIREIGKSSKENDGPETVSKLLRIAVDRHWQLVLSPDSDLRLLRNYEIAMQLDSAVREKTKTSPEPLLERVFPLLRKTYGEPLKIDMHAHKTEMAEALKPYSKKSAADLAKVDRNELENIFDKSVEPLLTQCMLLANIYIFGKTTRSLDSAGHEDYKSICGSFICKEAIPPFEWERGAVPVKREQCKLIYDFKGIQDRIKSRFLAKETRGPVCPHKVEPSYLQRGWNYLLPSASEGRKHDTRPERR